MSRTTPSLSPSSFPVMLAPGSFYRPAPAPTIPNGQPLPPVRTYRAVCVRDADGMVHECLPFDRHRDARMCTLNWDELYDCPRDSYWVERSLDGGQTWHVYGAEEYINGAPAWTIDSL